ncbi:T9SS type A sorting domain-containing protein [candidate division WOR-3 bacterium]|nr:T9SS type A sorting domain-containing protein [candidate division WOR-3 bacterium]
MYNVGEPQLPAIRELTAVPPFSNVDITASNTASLVLNGYMVYPYQELLPDGQPPGPFIIDTLLYSTNAFYPDDVTELGDPAVWRDVRVVHSSLYPITFNPVTQKLNVCYDFFIELDYWGISNVNVLPGGYPAGVGPGYAAMYRNQIINYDWFGLPEGERYSSYAYLVITIDDYADEIDPLVFWKQKKGFEVEVETVAAGLDPDSIKHIIKYDYEERKTEWVLLVGDRPDIDIESTEYGYSDYWYTLLSDDHYPELAIGRFSPANDTDVTIMVDKTFAYERTPCTSWTINEVLLVVGYNCPQSYDCNESIRKHVMEPINFKVNTAYAMDTLGIYSWATNDTVRHYVQENGGVNIINFRGHGQWGRWYGEEHEWSSDDKYFDTDTVRCLKNFRHPDSAWLPLVFNFCCFTGGIQVSECMTEAWTRADTGGAVGALGATNMTWGPVSTAMDTILFEFMFDPTGLTSISNYEIGKAINYAKVWVINNPPPGVTMTQILQVVYRHLWVGDPSLEVWTDSTGDLATFIVTHPTSIRTQPTQFTVMVEENNPVPGALVCLYKESDIYERGYTDSNGQITFIIEPNTAGILHVTVTNHHARSNYYYNYKPYEGTCRVLWAPGGPMSRDNSIIPKCFALGQSYPNPFGKITEIRYQIPKEVDSRQKSVVSMNIYDVTGRLVKTLVNEPQEPGYYRVLWDGKDNLDNAVPSGIYFYRIEVGNFTAVKKIVKTR